MTAPSPGAEPVDRGDETAAGIEPVRWWFGFRDPVTERAYRAWNEEKAVPFTRVGMIASLVLWVGGAIISATTGGASTGNAVAVELGLMVPVCAIGLIPTFLPRLRRWMIPWTALANCLAGTAAVLLSFFVLHAPDLAMGTLILGAYFAFSVFRLRPAVASLAVAPYVLLNQVLNLGAFPDALPELSHRIWFSVFPWMAFGTGLLVCVVLERVSRESYRQERQIHAQGEIIERERARADKLLASILPGPIAELLKKSPQMIAAHHPEVTVLFADIVGFTPMAAALSPEQLVQQLNQIFTSFDDLAAALGAEKIKTIGDAYMAVAGAPEQRPDHARVMAELALGMLGVLRDLKTTPPISIRIGLCSGPAVAGVIGNRKFAYDLWGDTVNTAARMESHGVAGGIHVTEETRAQLDGHYSFEDRGMQAIKGKGPMRTWLLTGRRATNEPTRTAPALAASPP